MQPFTHSPLNTKGCPKPPLDGRRKYVKCGSVQKRVGGICTKNDSSNDERVESNSPDGSNRAKVKCDDDYTIGE